MSKNGKAKKSTAVELLKKALEQHALPMTADGIQRLQEKEGAKATKGVVDACSYAMKQTPEGIDAFKGLRGADRFAHLERFCIDPSTAGLKCSASNSHSVAKKEEQGWQFADLTAKQLASSRWLNDEAHAAAVIKTLKEMGEAPGSTPDYKVLLYRYWYYTGSDTVGKTDIATTTAVTDDMSSDAYITARDNMRLADPLVGARPKPALPADGEPDLKKVKLEPAMGSGAGEGKADSGSSLGAQAEVPKEIVKVEEEDDTEVSDKITELEKALKESKLMKDKMTKELDRVPLIISNLEKKPYDCSTTIKWLKDKTDEQSASTTGLMDDWVSGKSLIGELMEDQKSMAKAEKLEKLTSQHAGSEKARAAIEQSYNKYKVNVLGEFSKFK